MLFAKLLGDKSGNVLVLSLVFAQKVSFPSLFDQNLQDLRIRDRQLIEIVVHLVEFGVDALDVRQETDDFPFPTLLDRCRPVLTSVPGWQQDISGVRRWEDLPAEARSYVEMIEKAVGCPISYVSVGPERDAYIFRG